MGLQARIGIFKRGFCGWCRHYQVNKESDEAVKEKVFSALVSAVKAIQQERAIILNALVRMRMRWAAVYICTSIFMLLIVVAPVIIDKVYG